MVWCNNCAKKVPGDRPYDGALACNLCGRILENFNFSDQVTFVKNAAGQSQASGNIVSSVDIGISSSRVRIIRRARDDLMNLRDALQIGDDRDDIIDMAVRFYTAAIDLSFTKGRRTELVLSSCLYLTCRTKNIPLLLIDFSSYLRVSVYELGSVYLQLYQRLFEEENPNFDELVDPSIFIPRFANRLLKSTHDSGKTKDVMKTATSVIASMKRDWMQTGRKPSGICGAAIYIASLSNGIMSSKTDIAKIVHMCGATITKRLNEFANTEAASLTAKKLAEREILHTRPKDSDKGGEVICKHKDSERFGYGLCESCYTDFVRISGGVIGGSDPPAFQRAEKERIEIEKSEGETYWNAEGSDQSENLSDLDDDPEVNGCLLDEAEREVATISWELLNGSWLEDQAAAKKAASEAFNARNPVEAFVAKSRKEKRQKRAEEAKNAPPPATAMEAVCRTLERKRLSGVINYDLLDELLDTSLGDKSREKSRTETVAEKKEVEIDDEEEPYRTEMNTDEKFYQDQMEEEEEEDGYDFELY